MELSANKDGNLVLPALHAQSQNTLWLQRAPAHNCLLPQSISAVLILPFGKGILQDLKISTGVNQVPEGVPSIFEVHSILSCDLCDLFISQLHCFFSY